MPGANRYYLPGYVWHITQRCQWENYVDDAHHDLSAIDDQIFALMSPHQDMGQGHSRRERVLHAISKRACVDSHPDTSRLRNRLDDQDNYTGTIQHLHESDPLRFRQLLGENMRGDALELMRCRQCMATRQGFVPYPELMLWSEDLSLDQIRTLLLSQIKYSLPAAETRAKGYGFTWSSWNEGLASIGSWSCTADPLSLVSIVIQHLGLDRLSRAISVVVKDQPTFGYAGILSVPDDIRLLVRSTADLQQELTLYHELGHAVAHALKRENGVFKTWMSVYDEAMAMALERIATLIFLDDAQRQAVRDLAVLETTRCATSALFELALWDQSADAEDLYRRFHGRWDIGTPLAGV